MHAAEIAKALAGLLEDRVAAHLGLRHQKRVEQADLRFAEADVVFLFLAHAGEEAEFLQPLLGKHAEGAVVETYGFFAAAERLEQFRQRDRLPVEIDVAVQLEPVDAAGDFHLEFAGLAIELPVGFDIPIFGQQGSDGGGKLAWGEFERVIIVGLRLS